jgi:transitional endoplasmic reticulum ATPase
VVQFLAEIGGFEENQNTLLILGATNKPWEIDEAVFRTGRFDEKIYIPPPDRPARLGILKRNLGTVPLEAGLDPEKWADRFDGYTGSDIVGIVNSAKRIALSRCVRDNSDPLIREADLGVAMKNIPSSLTEGMMKQYAKFRDARFA